DGEKEANHSSLCVLAMKAWLSLGRYGGTEKDLKGRCNISTRVAIRVVQRVVGDCVNGEGSRVRVKLVSEFLSNSNIVALFIFSQEQQFINLICAPLAYCLVFDVLLMIETSRQHGFKDGNECPELSKLASDYVRNSKGFNDELYVYFSNEKDVESVCANLVKELERCILGYFAFHWCQASLMINQVAKKNAHKSKTLSTDIEGWEKGVARTNVFGVPLEVTVLRQDSTKPVPFILVKFAVFLVLSVYDAHNEVACLMLESMTLELYRQFETYSPYEMLQELKSMFEKQDGVERLTYPETTDKRWSRQHCTEGGHCKRNCPAYLAELIKKKKQVGTSSSLDIFVIELFSFPTKSWVATPSDGINEIDMLNLLPNVNSNASYFITFTDDYSHYGYVYLLKHKHEVFETFKVFKYEVENQLGKTLKVLRSDRGDKYISQEFKDYLKACGIFQQFTPSYTPQHNGVSERRNRLIQRIINMVPTKKVDKTPYELCILSLDRSVGGAGEHEEIHVVIHTSKITSEIPMEVEVLTPHEKEAPVVGSVKRTHRDPDYYVINIWLDAMNVEMQSMKDNQVWRLVDLPLNAKVYTQLYGVDYEETFPHVADIKAIRILIAIAAFYDYEIWQMDVKNALNGYLDKNIYMVQPKGFVDPNHPRKVCKLQRSIYGFKQASRSWNKRFDEEHKRFEEAAFILRIKIYRDRSKRLIGLSQSDYMDKILRRFKMDAAKRGYILMQERLDLNKIQGASTPGEVKRMQNVPYASDVGSIINLEAELRVDCYCNAGFETDRDEIKSQTRYVFILNGRRSRLEKLQTKYYCNVCYIS
ncbi:retrotransposon protein, putative, ty1-copia subclass, partial [Tanacetum coccineum]